jgi:predicted secreted protein
MTLRTNLRPIVLSGSLFAAACGGSQPAAVPAAQPGEPIFKPVDPSVAPVAPTAASSPAALPPATLPQGSSAEPIAMVTDMAAGWPVTLRVGQIMSVRLTADPGAAGRWSMRAGSDGGIVAQQGEPATDAPAGTPPALVYRLVATKPGKTTVTFDLTRGAEAVALRSVSYPVTVQ